MIAIETTWLEHSGGTKFYETVLFRDTNSTEAMLVKRYGSMDKRNGAGVIIVERGSIDAMRSSAQKIIAEKMSSRKGYEHRNSTFGFHALTRGVAGSLDEVCNVSHYTGVNGTVYAQLRSYFPPDTTRPAPLKAAKPAPEPEIDRGATWGTF